MTNKKSTSSIPDFEAALKNLESIVTKMEGGELSLEQALHHFEQGVTLAKKCQQAIQQAEQRVQDITEHEQLLSPPMPNDTEE